MKLPGHDPRITLTPRANQIARVARQLLDEHGRDGLSMRAIGGRLGIRPASLYEHFADKRAVENAIIAAGLFQQGDFIAARLDEAAGAAHDVLVVAEAYRDFALRFPHLYRLIMDDPLDRAAPDLAAGERYVVGFLRRAVGDRWELGLAFWAFAHGVIDLELHHRLPPGQDLRRIWDEGLASLTAELVGQRG